MNSIFDTNVWVALFNEKDGHHDAAQGLLSV
jgi:predicted nucleic acid-binding protein